MAFPKAYVHRYERLPPVVVETPEQEAVVVGTGLWMQIAPQAVSPTLPEWPQLWYDVNLPPRLIHSQDQADQLGSNWRKQDLTPFVPDVPPVAIDPTAETAAAAGGSAQFHVTITGAGVSGTWIVDKDASATWLTLVSPTTPQAVDGDVTYSVAVNTGAERIAHFYVNGKTFTVTQLGP